LADVAWFEGEETLFIFYEMQVEQGLNEESTIEVRYTTDTEVREWTPIGDLPRVHMHVPADCGEGTFCGSTSLHVRDRPRDVEVRLRYHPDGELARDAPVIFNTVSAGSDHTNRSLLLYGVFDESNRFIQWRARHQFPTIRNQKASALGLRRWFEAADPRTGERVSATNDNPYAFGVGCRGQSTDLDVGPVSTTERAVFHPDPVPLVAAEAAVVCADVSALDGVGVYTTTAVARKNPEVAPAFPVLRSPVQEARVLPFFLGPCDAPFDEGHEAMQRQRTEMGGLPTTCIDDWDEPGFEERLAEDFSAAIEAARPRGDDMVLSITLHRNESGPQLALEQALLRVVPGERSRSTPRLAGAFVFDSEVRVLADERLNSSVLWCPSALPDGSSPENVNLAALTCAVAPDAPDFELGPFTFGQLPILPSRGMYNDFVRTYSERQAGSIRSLEFRAPRFSTTADHVDLGAFGSVTFLNGERITPDAEDAFSYCPADGFMPVVFRTPFTRSEAFRRSLEELCESGELPEAFCLSTDTAVIPLEYLPDWHADLAEEDYELGIFWDFPFLLRAQYETVRAGSVTAVGLSIPFGLAQNGDTYLGTETWLDEAYVLEDRLAHCRRFCAHPTFDSAGVYQISLPFSPTFANACYRPDPPTPGDGGFPRDP
ncbi:MAG TPA: hypothetical protein DFR83_16830, partial [Deltaproteobacteria bacterium]|nr:hypothetical protein [Deltaproteobacteria bacterium]